MNSAYKLAMFLATTMLCGCSTHPVIPPASNWTITNPPTEVSLDAYKNPNDRGDYQSNDISIAMAISGGGSRSANLAAGVMLGLEEIDHTDSPAIRNNLLMEVDYFSTVSGGGLAAGLYLEALDRHLRYDGTAKTFSFNNAFKSQRNHCEEKTTLARQLERGYHDNLVDGMSQPRVWFTNADRGDAIEEELDRAILGAECEDRKDNPMTLGDFFVPRTSTKPPRLPIWINNGTVFQNGWWMPFSPNVLQSYGIDGYWHNMKLHAMAGHDEDYFDVPVSIALKASASFPLAIPATTLRSNKCGDKACFIQVMDGGLSDNLGFISAYNLLRKEGGKNRKLLIVVDAFPGDLSPFTRSMGSPTLLQVLTRVTEINKDSFRHQIRHNAKFFDSANNVDLKILYLTIDDAEIIRKIRTNLNVNKKQQADLIICGQTLVRNHHNEIVEWFEGGESLMKSLGPINCTL